MVIDSEGKEFFSFEEPFVDVGDEQAFFEIVIIDADREGDVDVGINFDAF